MAKMPDDWYREEAKRLYGKLQTDKTNLTAPAIDVQEEGFIAEGTGKPNPHFYLPPQSIMSHGTSNGAWIMAWCWIPDPVEPVNDT